MMFATVSSRSKLSAQIWRSVIASMSCTVIRTRSSAIRTLPSITMSAPTWRAISGRPRVVSRYFSTDVRDSTSRLSSAVSRVNNSSCMPSAKCRWVCPALKSANGSTATELARVGVGRFCKLEVAIHTPRIADAAAAASNAQRFPRPTGNDSGPSASTGQIRR